MKTLPLFLVWGIAWGQTPGLPPVFREVMPNGLTVLVMEQRKLPVVHMRLVAHGGSAADPAGMEGTAEIATALMREGTRRRSEAEIARAIDFTGGMLHCAAGPDYCAASCEVLSKDLETGLDLLGDVVLHPVFPAEALERELRRRIAGIEAAREDAGTIASAAFHRAVYGSHPYGRRAGSASVRSVTRDALERFHRRTFRPGNSLLAVVGDVAAGPLMEKLRDAFGAWERGPKEYGPPGEVPPSRGRAVVLVDKPDATQAYIIAGSTGIGMADPDYFPLAVANSVFGDGFTSRLMEEIRIKRSLTYGVSSGFSPQLRGGSFSIATSTRNDAMGEVVDVILGELRKYRAEGASEEELRRAQKYLAGAYVRGLQTPAALAGELTEQELYGLPRDRMETYVARLGQVSAGDLHRVVRERFPLEDLVLVLVGPAGELKESAARYGPLQVLTLEEVLP
ncbi:MAG: pitrilysin family protein [Bacteroidota bacterium]